MPLCGELSEGDTVGKTEPQFFKALGFSRTIWHFPAILNLFYEMLEKESSISIEGLTHDNF